jgi:hypothetical protein
MIAQNIKSLDEKITTFDFFVCDGKIYFCENNTCNIVLKNENIQNMYLNNSKYLLHHVIPYD